MQFPNVLTVQVKDFGLVEVRTEKWTEGFVLQMVQALLKEKLEAARYGDKTQEEKRKDVFALRDKFQDGSWEKRSGSAATLTAAEEELRVALARRFVGAKQKKSIADKMAREPNRVELLRDLVIKPQLQELGMSLAPHELQQKAEALFHSMQQAAVRTAEAVARMREENEIEVSL